MKLLKSTVVNSIFYLAIVTHHCRIVRAHAKGLHFKCLSLFMIETIITTNCMLNITLNCRLSQSIALDTVLKKHHGLFTNKTSLPKCITLKVHRHGITLMIFPHKTITQLGHRLLDKNTTLKVGSHGKYSTRLRLVLYLPLNPTPCAVISVHHSQRCFNYMYIRYSSTQT